MNKLIATLCCTALLSVSVTAIAADAMNDDTMDMHLKMMDTNHDGMISKSEYMKHHTMMWNKMKKNKKGMVMMDDMKMMDMKMTPDDGAGKMDMKTMPEDTTSKMDPMKK